MSHSHTPEESESFWEKYAGKYEAFPVFQAGARICHEAVLKALDDAGASKEERGTWDVLEVGGGTGRLSSLLSPSFASIHLTDTSRAMLSQAALKFPSPPLSTSPSDLPAVTYSLFSVSSNAATDFALPQPSPTSEDPGRTIVPARRTFDLVFGTMMLHHVEDLEGFLKGCLGLLKEGGRVVFVDLREEKESTDQADNHPVVPDARQHAQAHSHAHSHAHAHHPFHSPSTLLIQTASNRPAHQHDPGFAIPALTAQLLAAGFIEPSLSVWNEMMPLPKDMDNGQIEVGGPEKDVLVVVARKAGNE